MDPRAPPEKYSCPSDPINYRFFIIYLFSCNHFTIYYYSGIYNKREGK